MEKELTELKVLLKNIGMNIVNILNILVKITKSLIVIFRSKLKIFIKKNNELFTTMGALFIICFVLGLMFLAMGTGMYYSWYFADRFFPLFIASQMMSIVVPITIVFGLLEINRAKA